MTSSPGIVPLLQKRRGARLVHFFTIAGIIISVGGRPFTSAGADKQEKQLKVSKPDGTELRVPATGPSSNEDAKQVATEVQDFDRQIRSFPKRRHSVDPKVLAAMREIALESRNDAVQQLDLAQQVGQMTSGSGTWDSQLVQVAKRSIGRGMQVLNASPPESLFVEAKISTSVSNATLRYCRGAEHGKTTSSWKSYNPGTKLEIGLYWFRVEAGQGQSEAYEEQVLVLNDPTILHISVPIRGSP